MANSAAGNLNGKGVSSPSLSTRINRRKQRARKTEETVSLWERVRAKREELLNQAGDIGGQSAPVQRTGRPRFEQIVEEAVAARNRQRQNEQHEVASPWKSKDSPDLSPNVPNEDEPKSARRHLSINGSFQEKMNHNACSQKHVNGVPKLNMRRASYFPPPARNPTTEPRRFVTSGVEDTTEDLRFNLVSIIVFN